MKKIFTIIVFILISLNFSNAQAYFVVSDSAGCAPLQITCMDSSINAFSWEYIATGPNGGPAGASVQQNASFTFVDPGVYTITLRINADTVPTFSREVIVYANPIANFSLAIDSGSVPLAVCFTDLSIPGDTNIVSWTYDYGGPFLVNEPNFCDTFFMSGAVDIDLLITDANGCADVFEIQDFIIDGLSTDILHDLNKDLRIYPNPVKNYLTIENAKGLQIISIDLLSVDGRKLTTLPVEEAYSLAAFPAGIYFLQFSIKRDHEIILVNKQIAKY